MFESEEKYHEIVEREARVLEATCSYHISHGEPGICPRCGRDGIWDIATKGFIHHQGNSIYYSTVFNQWRCGVCDDPARHIRPGGPICSKTGEPEERRTPMA